MCLCPLESDDEYFDAEDGDSQAARPVKASELRKAAEVPNEELVTLLLKFEIKEVCVSVHGHGFCLSSVLGADLSFKYIKNVCSSFY